MWDVSESNMRQPACRQAGLRLFFLMYFGVFKFIQIQRNLVALGYFMFFWSRLLTESYRTYEIFQSQPKSASDGFQERFLVFLFEFA
jgi:hypothetical protein